VQPADEGLSVVIPTFNRAHLLRELLESLHQQTLSSDCWEVIVVDDESGDDTQDLLAGWSPGYRFRWLRQANGGPAVARNQGVTEASGVILVFLDDDVMPLPNCLAAHFEAHRESRLSTVVVGRIASDAARNPPPWEWWEDAMCERAHRLGQSGEVSSPGSLFYSGNVSLRRIDFDQAGGFDPTMRRLEDTDLGRRLEQLGARFYFSDDAVVLHRGYRSFAGWGDVHYGYGRLWSKMSRRPSRGQGQSVAPADAFSDLHSLTRSLLSALIGRGKATRMAVVLLGWLGSLSYRLGLRRLSMAAFSVAATLLRWLGLADALGGRENCLRVLRASRRSPNAASKVGF
jgi:glycosyltransferase involved in cell wall biosynthesis